MVLISRGNPPPSSTSCLLTTVEDIIYNLMFLKVSVSLTVVCCEIAETDGHIEEHEVVMVLSSDELHQSWYDT